MAFPRAQGTSECGHRSVQEREEQEREEDVGDAAEYGVGRAIKEGMEQDNVDYWLLGSRRKLTMLVLNYILSEDGSRVSAC